jgi:hypothetical protein
MATPAQIQATIAQLQADLVAANAAITALQAAAVPPPPPPPPPAPTPPVIKVAKPDDYDGKPETVEKFLHQCNVYLRVQAYTDDQKVLLGLSFMKSGRALPWAENKLANLPVGYLWATFETDVRKAFGDTDWTATARIKIKSVKQGKATVDDYIVRFEEYSVLTGYNDEALVGYFKDGLNQAVTSKIFSLPTMPANLGEWKTYASRFDRQYREYLATTSSSSPSTSSAAKKTTVSKSSSSSFVSTPKPSSSSTSSNPTVKREPVDAAIAAQRKANNQCILCGSTEHWANKCPDRSSAARDGTSRNQRGRRNGHGNRSHTIRAIQQETPGASSSGNNEKSIYHTSGVSALSSAEKTALTHVLVHEGY